MKYFTDKRPAALDTLRSLHLSIKHVVDLTQAPLEGRRLHACRVDALNYPIPSLTLPFPEDINHAFDGFGLPSYVTERLTKQYRHRLEQLQQLYRRNFETACRDMARVPQFDDAPLLSQRIENFRKVTEFLYANHYLPLMKSLINDLGSAHMPTLQSKKPVFNTESTPLLERYFENNAYPSAPDRQLLAKKTSMTPRQIEVWFQNHRKRAKEHGKEICRLNPSLNAMTTYSIQNSSPSWKEPLEKHSDSLTSEREAFDCATVNAVSTKRTELLSSDFSPSLHAFPCRFSASTSVYRLHGTPTFKFPPPVWLRKASAHNTVHGKIDFDKFVENFASKLTIRSGTSKSKGWASSRFPSKNSWFLATTTVPSPAPHPALIRTFQPPDFHALFPPNDVMSSPNTLLSPLPANHRRTKKMAPFPKRFPSTTKYHPYWHVSNRTTRYSFESLLPVEASKFNHMPSRSRNRPPCETATPVSWVAALESEGTTFPNLVSETTTIPGDLSVSKLSSTPTAIIPSFGSRTSSLSSLDSSPPSSPTLELQHDSLFSVNSAAFSDFTDIEQLLMATPITVSEELFTLKPDVSSLFSFDTSYFSSFTHTCQPFNHISALS